MHFVSDVDDAMQDAALRELQALDVACHDWGFVVAAVCFYDGLDLWEEAVIDVAGDNRALAYLQPVMIGITQNANDDGHDGVFAGAPTFGSWLLDMVKDRDGFADRFLSRLSGLPTPVTEQELRSLSDEELETRLAGFTSEQREQLAADMEIRGVLPRMLHMATRIRDDLVVAPDDPCERNERGYLPPHAGYVADIRREVLKLTVESLRD